jgi:hypothetical protein
MIFDIFTENTMRRSAVDAGEMPSINMKGYDTLSPERVGDRVRVAHINPAGPRVTTYRPCDICYVYTDMSDMAFCGVVVDGVPFTRNLCVSCKSCVIFRAVSSASGQHRYVVDNRASRPQVCIWDSRRDRISDIDVDTRDAAIANVCKSTPGGGIFVQFRASRKARLDYVARMDMPLCTLTNVWHDDNKNCQLVCSRDNNLLALAYSRYTAFIDMRQPQLASMCVPREHKGYYSVTMAFVTENIYATVTSMARNMHIETVCDIRRPGECVTTRTMRADLTYLSVVV